MRAVAFAHAGAAAHDLVEEQVGVALGAFRAVLGVTSFSEVAEPYAGKLVFRPGARWPSIYDLRLLAFTTSWRNPPNRAMVTQAVQRLVGLSPIPYALVRDGSRLVAPPSVFMDDFDPDMDRLDARGWMMWFHRTEMLARSGVVRAVPELWSQVCRLARMLEAGCGRFTRRITHPSFMRWGAYTGLALAPARPRSSRGNTQHGGRSASVAPLDWCIAASAYILGSVPSGFIYSRLAAHVDLRTVGSRNIGGMNVARNVGVLPGAVTAATDIAKGAIAAYVGSRWGCWPYLGPLCAVLVVLGHNYMLFLGFRGGKGLGAAAGALLVLSPSTVPIMMAALVLLAVALHDTGAASGLGACLLPLVVWLQKKDGVWAALCGVLALIVLARHLPDVRAYARGRRQLV